MYNLNFMWNSVINILNGEEGTIKVEERNKMLKDINLVDVYNTLECLVNNGFNFNYPAETVTRLRKYIAEHDAMAYTIVKLGIEPLLVEYSCGFEGLPEVKQMFLADYSLHFIGVGYTQDNGSITFADSSMKRKYSAYNKAMKKKEDFARKNRIRKDKIKGKLPNNNANDKSSKKPIKLENRYMMFTLQDPFFEVEKGITRKSEISKLYSYVEYNEAKANISKVYSLYQELPYFRAQPEFYGENVNLAFIKYSYQEMCNRLNRAYNIELLLTLILEFMLNPGYYVNNFYNVPRQDDTEAMCLISKLRELKKSGIVQ